MVSPTMGRIFILSNFVILFAISVFHFAKISRHEQFIACWNTLNIKDKNKRCKNLKIEVLKGKGYCGRQFAK